MNTDRMNEYHYSELDESACAVRYLVLLPGKVPDPIQALLSIAPLTEDQVLNYGALSYAWGPSEIPTDIAIRNANQDEATSLLEYTARSTRGNLRAHIRATKEKIHLLSTVYSKNEPENTLAPGF